MNVVAGLFLLQSLLGSPASLDKQNLIARQHDYTYLQTVAQVHYFVGLGLLVNIGNSSTLQLHQVSFPVARPELKTFLERLSLQYMNACQEKLVVTSLTRPISKQPRNASGRSVHPVGIAVDIRIPHSRCRSWLEDVLLSLERVGAIEATRERSPPHYHVVVDKTRYLDYIKGKLQPF